MKEKNMKGNNIGNPKMVRHQLRMTKK